MLTFLDLSFWKQKRGGEGGGGQANLDSSKDKQVLEVGVRVELATSKDDFLEQSNELVGELGNHEGLDSRTDSVGVGGLGKSSACIVIS